MGVASTAATRSARSVVCTYAYSCVDSAGVGNVTLCFARPRPFLQDPVCAPAIKAVVFFDFPLQPCFPVMLHDVGKMQK